MRETVGMWGSRSMDSSGRVVSSVQRNILLGYVYTFLLLSCGVGIQGSPAFQQVSPHLLNNSGPVGILGSTFIPNNCL